MTSTVDDQGRLQLPPEVIARLGLKPGDRVIVESGAGQCILRPETAKVGLGWEGNVLVFRGVGDAPSIAELREERLDSLSDGRSR